MNEANEFLTKSLITAGVFLAIPAAASVLIVLLQLAIIAPYFYSEQLVVAFCWLAFCTVGFVLLFRCVRYVRTPDSSPVPRWLWPSTTIYLLFLTGGCVVLLHRAYVLARAGELKFWTAELTPQDLITPGIATFLPAWALILSLLIWSRHAINRNA